MVPAMRTRRESAFVRILEQSTTMSKTNKHKPKASATAEERARALLLEISFYAFGSHSDSWKLDRIRQLIRAAELEGQQ